MAAAAAAAAAAVTSSKPPLPSQRHRPIPQQQQQQRISSSSNSFPSHANREKAGRAVAQVMRCSTVLLSIIGTFLLHSPPTTPPPPPPPPLPLPLPLPLPPTSPLFLIFVFFSCSFCQHLKNNFSVMISKSAAAAAVPLL
jgi:hypothetical protein